MMIIEAIRDYFLSCPILDTFRKLGVDYLPPDELAYTIDPIPSDTTIRNYTDGGKVKQYLFVIGSREFYGDDISQNIENSGLYEKLADWLEMKSLVDELPTLEGNKRSQGLNALSSGYLFNATEDKARYQIQLRLVYYEGR